MRLPQALHAFLLMSATAVALPSLADAQDSTGTVSVSTGWNIDQAIPGMSWTSHPGGTNFALEWEATPVLYSFGISKLVSPWKFFFVRPPARFTGSVELIVAGQVYTSRFNGTHTGASVTLLGHVPLIEYGEDLGLNLGAARHWIAGLPEDFAVAGVSVLFGFLEYNIRCAPRDHLWIHQIAVRMF